MLSGLRWLELRRKFAPREKYTGQTVPHHEPYPVGTGSGDVSWCVESDCEAVPPPSPLVGVPRENGVIVLPPRGDFPSQCACCRGDVYGVMCSFEGNDDRFVHYGCLEK